MNVIELESGMLLCVKGMPTLVTADSTTKALVARVSTESVDSDGDIVHQGKNKVGIGWVLERFNKAPLLSWMHDPKLPNIASPEVRAKVGNSDKGRALFLDPFAFDIGDDFAMGIAGKYARGVLKETSVGFIGIKWDKRMEGDRFIGREYFEQELIEVSAVNRGANPDTDIEVKALDSMMARMVVRPKVAARLETGGDAELTELRDIVSDLQAEIKMLANVIKTFSDCAAPVRVIENRAQAEAELTAVGKSILARLAQTGLRHE